MFINYNSVILSIPLHLSLVIKRKTLFRSWCHIHVMRHVILRDVTFIVNAWKTTSVNDYESLTQTMQFKIQPTEEILIEKEKKLKEIIKLK